MRTILNQYSYVVLAVILLGIIAYSLSRKGMAQGQIYLLIGLFFGLITLWFFVRPQAGVTAPVSEIRAQLGDGTPVLIEFQSPY